MSSLRTRNGIQQRQLDATRRYVRETRDELRHYSREFTPRQRAALRLVLLRLSKLTAILEE